jgi:hypothetical protein
MDESPHHGQLREIMALLNYRESRKQSLHRYQKQLKQLKKSQIKIKIPWYMNPKAVRARTRRKKASHELQEVSTKINNLLMGLQFTI